MSSFQKKFLLTFEASYEYVTWLVSVHKFKNHHYKINIEQKPAKVFFPESPFESFNYIICVVVPSGLVCS